MLAAACAAKCPPHAVAAVAGALVVGFVAGRLTKRCKCAGKKHHECNHHRRERQPVAHKEPARQPVPAGSVEIYVGNLSYDLTEDQLRKEFEAYGKVNSARIITNRYNNKSKGFGFIHMPNRAEADAAVKALSDKEILGRKLKCNEAKNLI